MIIDAHVSVDRERYPIDKVLSVLSASKVYRAIIFADPHAESIPEQNRYVLEAAREHDLFPFYYLGGNPWSDSRPDSLELPANLDEYAGIRWHRWVGEGFDRTGEFDRDELDWAMGLMESPEFEAFAAAAAHYNLPVLFEESLAVTVEFVLRF